MKPAPRILTAALVSILAAACLLLANCSGNMYGIGTAPGTNSSPTATGSNPTGTGGNTSTGTGGTTSPTGTTTGTGTNTGGSQTYAGNDDEHEMLTLINQYRKSNGVPELKWDDAIARVALDYANHCAVMKNYWPNNLGKGDVPDRIIANSIVFSKANEVGAWVGGPDGAQPTFSFNYIVGDSNWAKILKDPAYTRVGVAHTFDSWIG
jgi:uncharacterized protein YkwD